MKVGIITITGEENFGNRLQNYAVQEILKLHNTKPYTFYINKNINSYTIYYLKKVIKNIYYTLSMKKELLRFVNFYKFDKNINFAKNMLNNKKYSDDIEKKFDFFIAGSDQIWNLNYKENDIIHFLGFIKNSKKKISLSASFGSSNIPNNISTEIPVWLKDISVISVREDSGKDIVKTLTNRSDVEVLIDPTMMLSSNNWDKVSKKPKNFSSKKYILNYFLGELKPNIKKEIERIAKQNNCEIINILDVNSPYYSCGPSEFLYLEKNAFLICTDSFHSCIFSIIYNKPFIVFEREDKNIVNMNSRIETLINKFQLKNRKFNGKITEQNLNHDYSKAYEILELEKNKFNNFLKKAFNVK